VGSLLVVPAHPVTDLATGMLEVLEEVLPDALLLQAPEEALHDAVLLRRIGCDELLGQAVVPHGRSEAGALKNESVIRADNGGFALRADGAETAETGRSQSPFGFPRSFSERELVPDDLAVMAVDESHQVPPAVLTAVDVSHVHRPTLIASLGAGHAASGPRPRRMAALMAEPAFQLEDAVDGLPVDLKTQPKAQDGPRSSGSRRWGASL
jgi:hypothetical protein